MSNEAMTLPVQISFKKDGEFGIYKCSKCPFLNDMYDDPSHCTLFDCELNTDYVCSACGDFIWKSLKKMNGEV